MKCIKILICMHSEWLYKILSIQGLGIGWLYSDKTTCMNSQESSDLTCRSSVPPSINKYIQNITYTVGVVVDIPRYVVNAISDLFRWWNEWIYQYLISCRKCNDFFFFLRCNVFTRPERWLHVRTMMFCSTLHITAYHCYSSVCLCCVEKRVDG